MDNGYTLYQKNENEYLLCLDGVGLSAYELIDLENSLRLRGIVPNDAIITPAKPASSYNLSVDGLKVILHATYSSKVANDMNCAYDPDAEPGMKPSEEHHKVR